MSKLSDKLNEARANTRSTSDELAHEIQGTFEDLLFQFEMIAEMDALSFNVSKKVRSAVSDMRKLSNEVVKDIKGGKK